ncbi:MAG: tetratricopeptide repeat protein [Deltaproteobacteria bacterium]|nr:tetratricopeptide repeat protein [Deltaproteobacteria bacterium]
MAQHSRARARHILAAVVVFVLVAAVYAPSVQNGFVYDDVTLIVNRDVPDSAADVKRLFTEPLWRDLPYYRPLSGGLMALEKFLFDNNPAPYHAVNAALAGSMAVAFFRLVSLPALGAGTGTALLFALLFGTHPAASAAVYPITVLETLLVTLFALAALRSWITGGRRGYLAALLFLILALLSKEPAVAVPPLFVLADVLRVSRLPGSRARAVLRHLPAWTILAGYMAARHLVLSGQDPAGLALLDNLLGPLQSLAYTLQTLVAPFRDLVYEPEVPTWFSGWRLALGLLPVAAAAAWAVFRPPARRSAAFFACWFLLFLLPTANILMQEARFAERYCLTPLAGFLGVFAVLAGREHLRPRLRAGMAAALAILVAGAATVSMHRARFYADEHAFLLQWVQTSPDSPEPRSYLGTWNLKNGRPAEAVAHYRIALMQNPEPRVEGITRSNLGVALGRMGRPDEAMAQHRLALALAPDHPEAHLNYGFALEQAGRLEEARTHYQVAAMLDPFMVEAHHDLGMVAGKLEHFDEAAKHFSRAVGINPRFAPSWLYLGHALARMGRYGEALVAYQKVLKLDPDNADAARGMDTAVRFLYTLEYEPTDS